ncbi:MAG TPA: hypothetical protein VN577_02500 [Terriglobales bacterium]|nr:hypothetical protein [Terriglobales bacterium]
MRNIIRWSLTTAVRDADVWHLSDSLTFQQALAEAQRENFPYLVQRRLLVTRDGRVARISRKSILRVPGVPLRAPLNYRWHAECLRCECRAQFQSQMDAEWWRDIHEFENYSDGHLVRVLLETDKSLIDMADVADVEIVNRKR